MFHRVHRGRKKHFSDADNPRDIIASFISDKDKEWVKGAFIKKARKKENEGIYCEPFFGPETQFRRNAAKKLRRELLDEGKIVSGYVDFPAKLFVKKTRDPKATIVEYKDFSKIPVPERFIRNFVDETLIENEDEEL